MQKSHQKMVNPRDMAGNVEEEQEDIKRVILICKDCWANVGRLLMTGVSPDVRIKTMETVRICLVYVLVYTYSVICLVYV